MTGFISVLMLLIVSCQSGEQKESAKKPEIDPYQLPEGWVEEGEVFLHPLGVKLHLPVQVYGNIQSGQWLANTPKGTFKIAVALFETTSKQYDPKAFVKSRTKKLLGENREPLAISATELERLIATEGFRSELQVDQSMPGTNKVVSSRSYLIEAMKYSDGSILLISVDADRGSFPEVDTMLQNFIDSITGIERRKPASPSTKS